jgi:hypothetical protein
MSQICTVSNASLRHLIVRLKRVTTKEMINTATRVMSDSLILEVICVPEEKALKNCSKEDAKHEQISSFHKPELIKSSIHQIKKQKER